ncbi:MAG: MerR family transcriptional regulator [Planctomycetes bacterium]|nr:MerR family transcriptional regulator [Planctomycetota bacterium]
MTPSDPEYFTLETAGKTLGVSLQDIQAYVDEGLVAPRRDTSGTAYFTRVEMRRLWSIVTLHRDVGINLPGVAAVLSLREQYERMRRDLELLMEIIERELGPGCWDRLWPQGRPRPETRISADGAAAAGVPPPGEPQPPPDAPPQPPAGG